MACRFPARTFVSSKPAPGALWVSWTDETGRFRFAGIAAFGHYRIEVSQLGFDNATQEFDLGSEPGAINVTLPVASLETIEAAATPGPKSQPNSRRRRERHPIQLQTRSRREQQLANFGAGANFWARAAKLQVSEASGAGGIAAGVRSPGGGGPPAGRPTRGRVYRPTPQHSSGSRLMAAVEVPAGGAAVSSK